MPNRCCVRVADGGAVLDTVSLDRGAFACMLGGSTLYVVANEWGGVENTKGGRVTRCRRAAVPAGPSAGRWRPAPSSRSPAITSTARSSSASVL